MATSNLLNPTSATVRRASSSEYRPKHRVEQATYTAPSVPARRVGRGRPLPCDAGLYSRPAAGGRPVRSPSPPAPLPRVRGPGEEEGALSFSPRPGGERGRG